MKVLTWKSAKKPPPEGRLISEALARTGMSIRAASRKAGISYGRWRQITTGYQNVSAGSYARVHAPPATLARMAGAVGVTPGELEEAGRQDAAADLRKDLSRPASLPQPAGAGPATPDEQRMVSAFLTAIRSGEPVPLPATPEPQHDVLGELLARHGISSLDEVPGMRQIWQIDDHDLPEMAKLGAIELALKMRDKRLAEDVPAGERRRNSA